MLVGFLYFFKAFWFDEGFLSGASGGMKVVGRWVIRRGGVME